MSDYLLYGTKMIEKDDTMKDFAESIVKSVPADDLKALKLEDEEDEKERFEEPFMERVHDILVDDISRTDIDYQELMCKYSSEIGDLLYDMDNHGYDLENYPLHFFGDKAKDCFNALMNEYIYLMVFHI